MMKGNVKLSCSILCGISYGYVCDTSCVELKNACWHKNGKKAERCMKYTNNKYENKINNNKKYT